MVEAAPRPRTVLHLEHERLGHCVVGTIKRQPPTLALELRPLCQAPGSSLPPEAMTLTERVFQASVTVITTGRRALDNE